MYNSRQNQSKRQREWVYLSHYLAVSGLNPAHIISGRDNGQEPDFTLVFYRDGYLDHVGIELTTLPRLRDIMGDEGLIAKRWYWQSLHKMAILREKEQNSGDFIQGCDRFRMPLQTLYMPKTNFASMPNTISTIAQQDIDEVMKKKAHKVNAYHNRRPLKALWLLVHTDKYQPEFILTAPDYQLVHKSGFDQIHVTRYPSYKIISINKL